MDDLRAADGRFPDHWPVPAADPPPSSVERFVPLGRVRGLRPDGARQGLPDGLGAPLTRSSYHAGDDFERLRAAREAAFAHAAE